MKLKSIQDEQPKVGVEVLCLRDSDNEYFVGSYCGQSEVYEGKHVFMELRECIHFDDVTHWCELPKP